MKKEFVLLRLGLKIISSFSRRPCLGERAGSEIIEEVILGQCLKGFKLILLILLLLLTSVGCKSANTSANIPDEVHKALPDETTHIKKRNEIIIAMVPKSLDNPVFLDAKEEGERTAKELGIKLEWLGSMQSDPAEQAAIVESLIRRQVDGIVISCSDPLKMRPVINKAVKAGIKVATFDSDSPGSDRIFYCGTNNYAAGDACAKALIKALSAKKRSNDELNLLIMSADKDSYNLNERLHSFMDTAQKGGLKLHLLDTLYCKDDINMAGDMLEKYIRKGAKVDVFFSTGGWPLIVPSESMPEFRKWCLNGGTSIVVDTFYPIVDAAKKGMADALVGQDFKKMGELSVRNLYKVIKGGKVTSQYIDTGLELGDKSNYDILLKSKKSWEIK